MAWKRSVGSIRLAPPISRPGTSQEIPKPVQMPGFPKGIRVPLPPGWGVGRFPEPCYPQIFRYAVANGPCGPRSGRRYYAERYRRLTAVTSLASTEPAKIGSAAGWRLSLRAPPRQGLCRPRHRRWRCAVAHQLGARPVLPRNTLHTTRDFCSASAEAFLCVNANVCTATHVSKSTSSRQSGFATVTGVTPRVPAFDNYIPELIAGCRFPLKFYRSSITDTNNPSLP